MLVESLSDLCDLSLAPAPTDRFFRLVSPASQSLKPQQRLLTLTHAERKTRAARVVGDVSYALVGNEGDLKVSFSITADAIAKQIGTLGGDYDVEVVVADARFKESYRKAFWRVTVSHAEEDNGKLSADPPLDARERRYAPKKEVSPSARSPHQSLPPSLPPSLSLALEGGRVRLGFGFSLRCADKEVSLSHCLDWFQFTHVMREGDKRPAEFWSVIFAAGSFFPLLLCLLASRSFGANLKGLGPVFVRALVFHVSLAGVLGFIACYWISLPFLQTLPILSGLGAVAALAGFSLLSKKVRVD